MCLNHDKVNGSAAVEALIEAQLYPESACEGRVQYLIQQAESYRTWLEETDPENAEERYEAAERRSWALLKNDALGEFVWSREEQYDTEGKEQETDMLKSLSDINAGLDKAAERMEEGRWMWANAEREADRIFSREEHRINHDEELEQRIISYLKKVTEEYEAREGERHRLSTKTWYNVTQKAMPRLWKHRVLGRLNWESTRLFHNWMCRLISSEKRISEPELNLEDVKAEVIEIYYTRD
jgi:hypothetical protein